MRYQNRILWALGAKLALCIGYLLCRYVFWGLHGMDQWPLVLFIFGLIVLVVAAIFDGRRLMVCTVLGYMIGFALGMGFHWDTYRPEWGSGVYTNNRWSIWTLTFLLCIGMGIAWEIVRIRQRKRKGVQER